MMMGNSSLLKKWFVGTLSPRAARRLFAVLKKNETLRRQFNQVAEFETAVFGSDESAAVSPLELKRIEDIVLAQAMATPEKTNPGWTCWRLVLILSAAIVIVSMAIAVWTITSTPATRPSGNGPSPLSKRTGQQEMLFTPRGQETPYQTHLFLFCVTNATSGTLFHRLDRPLLMHGPSDTCPIDGEFQFALTNLTRQYAYVYVLGIDARGHRLWYMPTPRESQSRAIDMEVSEQLLGESVVLNINHQPGEVQVFAVFSQKPLTHNDISNALDTRRGVLPPSKLNDNAQDVYVETFRLNVTFEGVNP